MEAPLSDLVTPVISFFAAIAGGLVAHFLSLSREKTSKRREIMIKYKMELWRLIDKSNGLAAETVGDKSYDAANWEEIVREIQLLGTDEQIAMVKKIAAAIGTDKDVPFVPLMKSLQDELRHELGMKKAVVPYFWTRVTKSSPVKSEIKS